MGIFMSGSVYSKTSVYWSGSEDKYISTCERGCNAAFWILTRDGLEVFRLIIGVSGIGPKGRAEYPESDDAQ